MAPRRELWQRFTPFHVQRNLHLVMLEIADDLDKGDARWAQFDRRMAKLTGIATGLLISVTTGVLLLGLNLIVGR